MKDSDENRESSLIAPLNSSNSSLDAQSFSFLKSKEASPRRSSTTIKSQDSSTSWSRKSSASGMQPDKDESARNESNISKVEKSWYLINDKIDKVGLVFFLNLFKEHPDLLELFPFTDGSTSNSGMLQLSAEAKVHLQAHARVVMRVVGTCVAGLTRIEELVPKLRHIGATHRQVGVQDLHYDVLFHYLVGAIRDEVGPDNWDEETEEAWEQAYASITNLIKRPSRRLETEPLEGWGLVMAVACSYFMMITPFRLAGFTHGRGHLEVVLDVLDACAALVLATDLFVDTIQTKIRLVRLKRMSSDLDKKLSRRESFHRGLVQQRKSIVQTLHSYGMDRWVPWPTNDMKVLLSFPLQFAYRVRPGIGLHWTHLLALVRVSTAARVFHFLQCAENKALFEQKLDKERQVHVRVAQLLLRLFFVTHIAACVWCIVARFEMGADAQEVTPTSFFPNTEILFGATGVMNSYIRTIHWAFVNLAGIGDVDSTPVTTFECSTTIVIHICGAIFYAIVTGNVIEMVEAASDRENKIGTDIAKLTDLMNTAKVSDMSKDRIMKGYMMRNVLTQSNDSASQHDDGLDLHDEVLNTLPNYLRQEMAIYARASLLSRRDTAFRHCSNSFLVALSCCLSETRTLLTGDYLMKRGEKFEMEFIMVESGSLQVRLDNHTIKTLERGNVVGKGWLLHTKNNSSGEGFNEYTDWCCSDRTAGLSIRALSPCTLLTGLSNILDITKLESGYKVDFGFLRAEARGSFKDEGERRMSSMLGVVRAVERFKKRSIDLKSSRDLSSASHVGGIREEEKEKPKSN